MSACLQDLLCHGAYDLLVDIEDLLILSAEVFQSRLFAELSL